MIHLDTNYLVGLADWQSPAHLRPSALTNGLRQDSRWPPARSVGQEFLNNPVLPEEIALVESVISERIVPFDKETAVIAAELFNKTGRRRGSRFDCLIAATAILAQAEFATENSGDFAPFVGHALKLAV